MAWTRNILGLIDLQEGRPHEAVTALASSLELHLTVGDRWRQASLLESLAAALLQLDARSRATELAGLAASIRHTIGVPVPAIEHPAWDRLHEHLPLHPPAALPRPTFTTIRTDLADVARAHLAVS